MDTLLRVLLQWALDRLNELLGVHRAQVDTLFGDLVQRLALEQLGQVIGAQGRNNMGAQAGKRRQRREQTDQRGALPCFALGE